MAMMLNARGSLVFPLLLMLSGCGSSASTENDGIVASADTDATKQIPPGTHNGRWTPQWTECSATCCRDPRQVPFDLSIPFEAKLVEWGCWAQYAYKPNPKA